MIQVRTALYARRSNQGHEPTSIEVQIGEASRDIDRRGWTLAPEHIFVDADHGHDESLNRHPGGN